MNEDSEIFDIVDDSDKIIGSASRYEVHKRGLKHRSVHLLSLIHISEPTRRS